MSLRFHDVVQYFSKCYVVYCVCQSITWRRLVGRKYLRTTSAICTTSIWPKSTDDL